MRRIALFLVSCAVLAAACSSSAATTAPTATTAPPSTASSAASASEALPTSSALPTASIADTAAPSAVLPAGWSTFTPDDGSFSIAFPGTPVASHKTQSTALGDVAINGFVVVKGGVTYSAIQERFASGTLSAVGDSERGQFLGGVITGLGTSTEATVSNAADLTFAGYPAKKATLTANGQSEDAITFVFADDCYILVVKYNIGATVDTTPFFGSFLLP
jgi:hypothetical protein